MPDTLLEGDGWSLRIPDGFIPKPAKAWGYDSGVIARGWIGEAPVTAIVQVKQLDVGFNEWTRTLAASWIEHDPPRRVKVPGAAYAVRIEGFVQFDGLGAADGREWCVAIIAKRGKRVTSFTIRCRPEDAIEADLEPILASFVV